MKQHNFFLLAAASAIFMLALAASAFWVGNVYAATDCFSDIASLPTVFQEAICWMKDSGVTSGYPDGTYRPNGTVTRAQMALFMKNQAEVPPSTGYILVSAGNSNWVAFSSSSTTTITRYSTVTRLDKPTTGSEFFTIQPDFTPVLYGRSLNLVGVEFCYTASANAYIDYVEINTHVATNSAGTRTLRLSDLTDRTDSACRYYVLSTPVTLTAEDGVSFYAQINWATASAAFDIGRTTFVFLPTGTQAAAPASLSENVVVLSESNNDASLPDTSAP